MRKRWHARRGGRIQGQITALRVADDGDRPGGPIGRISQVARRPQLSDRREVQAELRILRPADRSAIGAAETT